MIPYPNIRPEIIKIGPLAVRWYGLMYVCGYVLGWFLLKSRARQGLFRVTYSQCENFITYMIVSMLLGARLTYAFVYNWDIYSENPWQIIKIWEGGLSFHGAALGMCVGCILFARNYKLPIYSVIDSLAYCSAPGLIFGRIGNFINGELYGRPTDLPWAMVFPTDPEKLPRHPSQIYQGLTEGILLFVILYFFQKWLIKKGQFRHGLIAAAFGMLYGVIRFFTEFAREPDKQLGFVLGPFSMGQVLCLILFVIGLIVLFHVLKTQPRIKPIAVPEVQLREAQLGDAKPSRKSKS